MPQQVSAEVYNVRDFKPTNPTETRETLSHNQTIGGQSGRAHALACFASSGAAVQKGCEDAVLHGRHDEQNIWVMVDGESNYSGD